MLLVIWCDPDGKDEKVHAQIRYYKVSRPHSVSVEGLFQLDKEGLQSLGIESIDPHNCSKLVGMGTDGAAANVAAAGLMELFEKELNWMFWMRCLAHRLELEIKDVLVGTSFDSIDELLLRLYYIYENFPKKCRELVDIIADFREFFEFNDAGVNPIRASGSRWITHKLSATKRVWCLHKTSCCPF